MSEHNITQSNVTANGHVAGRDVNIFQSNGVTSDPSGLRILIEKAANELRTNQEYREIYEGLQAYVDNVDGDQIIGLEAKLRQARREGDIMKAKALKEQFNKKLHRHLLSYSAQKAYSYILAKLEMLFDLKVKPLLACNSSVEAIDKAVADLVLIPLSNDLDASNDLGLSIRELRGMLYFLTGNCHIKWTA